MKDGKDLVSYKIVLDDEEFSIDNLVYGIKFFCKKRNPDCLRLPLHYYYDRKDPNNEYDMNLGAGIKFSNNFKLPEGYKPLNIPNYWYLRLGFLLVSELNLTNYNDWKLKFDSLVKSYIVENLQTESDYELLVKSVWNHKYETMTVCEKYVGAPIARKILDKRMTIAQLAKNLEKYT